MLRKRLLLLLGMVGVIWIVGCSTLRQLVGLVAERPEVKLLEVDIRSLSSKSMDLDFVLEVANPNNFTVDIEHLDYNVRSLNLDLGSGTYKDQISLAGKAKTQVRLPFRIDPNSLVELMKKYLQNPRELKVKLRASFFMATTMGKLDLHFEEEKTIMKGLSNL